MLKLSLLAALAFACAVTSAVAAQTDRAHAMRLWDEGKYLEALPLLQGLAASNPADRVVQERLGFALFQRSATLPDADARKKDRAAAHAAFAQAKQLGMTDAVIDAMLKAIPEDGGSDLVFAENKVVDEAIHRGEGAFAARDFLTAILAYQEALAFDPSQYDAALFTGDAYYQLKQVDSAFAWYGRATAINPDRETAWRYWSDVLKRENRLDEARDKAIEAVIAEPFNRLSRQGLVNWAQTAKVPVALPLVNLPPKDTLARRSAAALAYDSVRKSWQGGPGQRSVAFAARYPAEPTYRHSLAEEVDAFGAASRVADTTVSGANLRTLATAGMLEAFIFFARADQGISRDYRAYAREHHDVLRRFWLEFVIGAKYAK